MSIKYVKIRNNKNEQTINSFIKYRSFKKTFLVFVVSSIVFLVGISQIKNNDNQDSNSTDGKGNGFSVFSGMNDFSEKCSKLPKNEYLSGAEYPELQKLNSYQELCDSFVSDSMMAFSIFPITENEIKDTAKYLGGTINEYSLFKINPIILIEPVHTIELLSVKRTAEGDYENQLHELFNDLQESRNDTTSVLWVPYPEINTPSWDRQGFEIADFSKLINDFNRIAKEHFPQDKVGVLFNSESHPVWDKDWSAGKYLSLNPYLEGLDKDAVDVLLVQGFPWIPPTGQKNLNSILDPQEYLIPQYIAAAAQKLGTDEVWINTGTFRKIHTDNAQNTVEQTPHERKIQLEGIFDVAKKLHDSGLNITVHLFAQDKTTDKEATDWSYTKTNEELMLLKNFITRLYSEKVNFAIYDK